MGLVEKVKGFMLGSNDDEYFADDYDDYDDDIVDIPKRDMEPPARSKKQQYENNVVSMPNMASQKEHLVITHPKTIDDAPSIADYLRMNTACVVNLEGVDHSSAQRIADIIGGAVYALGCDIERISNDIFIVAPAQMGISNETKEELKSGGHILPWISSALR